MTTILADAITLGSGDGLVHQLFVILLIGICVGVVYAAGWWFIKRPPIPPVILTIWQGLFILIGTIIIVNFLLGLAGHSFLKW